MRVVEYKATCSLNELFPIVCATSFQVLEMNRSFRTEYMISQLLMQVVNELGINGVAYISKNGRLLCKSSNGKFGYANE